MAKGKAGIATPFESCIGAVSGKKGVNGVYDKNRTPLLSKPHSMGSDTIPLKFYSSSPALEPNTEKFATPFGNTLSVKGKKRGV